MSGKLFVIEGIDGSGKATQHALLGERLAAEGYKTMLISYPRYENESSALARMYLRGDFGENPESVSAYISSTFFAADRYASYKTEYEEFYTSGGIVLADRYATSNMVHQASKIAGSDQRQEFLDWLWDLEFSLYGIPVPTQVFFLDINAQAAYSMLQNRDGDKDIHETSLLHLQSAYDCALQLCSQYGWELIKCIGDGRVLSINEIHSELYSKLRAYL
ncbi:MAG: thymidylate kinase [Eubacteriaceae bacterium]|nr:thymidylate kinase [Eubacteriaceae bacterium]